MMAIKSISLRWLEWLDYWGEQHIGDRWRISWNDEMAEEEGFEPSIRLNTVYTLSRRAPSTARPPLRNHRLTVITGSGKGENVHEVSMRRNPSRKFIRAPNPDFKLVKFIVLAGLVPATHAHPSGKMPVERRGYAGRARA